MGSYISSTANRFYAALESSYGQAAAITTADRFPAKQFAVHQTVETAKRFDKTGTRSYTGSVSGARPVTAFEIRSFLASVHSPNWLAYGPLFQAALGGNPTASSGLVVNSATTARQLQTVAPHGLSLGLGISVGGQLRFVTSILDAQTFEVNAPFKPLPSAGTRLAPTLTYRPASQLASLSLYDYWDPATAVSRILVGAAVDLLRISIGGDLHEFVFAGPAADLLDSQNLVTGAAGLQSFPNEPALTSFDYTIVPGRLGEAWLGGIASQFFTLAEAAVTIRNNIETRAHEYGFRTPRGMCAGERVVSSSFVILAQDDAQSLALYSAAKSRMPVPAMLQLGQQQGQIMGIYLPNVIPGIPLYDDSEPRLRWEFDNNLAQGTADNEIAIAFA